MNRKVLSLLLVLILCFGLAIPAMAAEIGDTSITTKDGYTYKLSNSIVGTESRTDNGITNTVYLIPEGTIITTPSNFDKYSLTYYTPPYDDNTQPIREMGSGAAPSEPGDYIAHMYKSYLVMFQAFPDYTPADITGCVLKIYHNETVFLENDYRIDTYAEIFFRNVASETTLAPETPSSWAVDQVNAAITAGIVPEVLQSKYTTATTRAEFCALAVALYETATGKEIVERTTFNDTSDVNVQKMGALGVVTGVGNGNFAPGNKLTREQAATMLSRLADALGEPMTKQAPTFADNASISSWAFDAVGQVQAAGVMSGVGDNTFSPATDYTREQSIITIMRLFDVVK